MAAGSNFASKIAAKVWQTAADRDMVTIDSLNSSSPCPTVPSPT